MFQAHLEAAGGSDWTDARRASALVSLLGREGQRKYFAAAEQEEARNETSNAASTTPSNAASTPASDPDSLASAVSKFDSLVKQLDRLFAASTNPLVERHEFTSRRQLPGESFLDYVTVLKEKAVRCKFGLTYAERVRDQIIHGSSNARVREKLLAYGEELSLEKAEEVGRTLEALSLANQAFAPSQPENVQAVGQGAQYGGAKRKNGRASWGGRDVTSAYPGGQDGDFQPQSSSGFRAPVPNGKSQGDFQPQSCDRCGSRRHQSSFRNCPARSRRCNACNAWGHFASMCRKTAPVQRVFPRGAVDVAPEQQASTQLNSASSSSVLSSDHPSSPVLTVSTSSRRDLVVHAVVDGVTLRLLVDTGASVSLMTAEDFQRHFSKQHSLSKAVVDLRNFSKQRIRILGSFQAPVKVLQRSCSVVFYVTDKGTSLLGLDAIQRLGIQIDGASLTCRLASCEVQCPSNVPPGFEQLFSDELGLVKGFIHRIQRRPGVTPVASKLRRLPLALRDQVSTELRRLEDSDVIERVDASEWVSPLVVVRKKNGSIRLCVDLRDRKSVV